MFNLHIYVEYEAQRKFMQETEVISPSYCQLTAS